MKKQPTNAVVLSEEQRQYNLLHSEVVQYGNMATTCFVQFMAKLKEMRDSKLYQAAGIQSFGEYVEQQVGIKERQAYNYIFAYETYSEEFLHSNAKIGITKLLLLAPLEENKRQELMENVDVENTSVKELKETIAERDKKIAEQDQQIEQLQLDYDTLYNDADSVRAERDDLQEQMQAVVGERNKLQQKADSLEQQKADWQSSANEIKKMTEQLQKNEQEKQKLLQEIERLKNTPAKVETVDNPETVKDLDNARKRIQELEEEQKALAKKLEVVNDETLYKFKTKFDDLQLIGQDIMHLLSAMDDETSANCKAALKAVVGGWQL